MAIRFGRDPEQFNRNLSYIMQYLSQMNLMKKREAGRERLLEKQMVGREQYLEKQTEGWKGIETQRQAGTQKKIEQELFGKLAVLPSIQHYNSLIQLHGLTKPGEPVPQDLVDSLKKATLDGMQAAVGLSKGETRGIDLGKLSGLSDAFVKQVVGDLATTHRQREKALLIEGPKTEQQAAATAQRGKESIIRDKELEEGRRQFNKKLEAGFFDKNKESPPDALKTWFDQLGKFEDALIDQITNLTTTNVGGENDEAIANNRAKLKNINAEREVALSSVYGETGLPEVEAPAEEAPPVGDWFTGALKPDMPPPAVTPATAPVAEPEIPPEVTSYLKLHPDKTLGEVMAAYNAWLATQR